MKTFAAIILFAIAVWLVPFYWQRLRRRYLRSRPLSRRQLALIREHLPIHAQLAPAQQNELQKEISLFLRDKEFVGCEDLEVTETMRVVIAAHACLLLLQRETLCYPNLHTILLYPDTYVAMETRRQGYVETKAISARQGEAHYRGPVVLSWTNIQNNLSQPDRGHNVILHEFAHKIDEEDGYFDGRPVFSKPGEGKAWAPILGEAYKALRERRERLLEHPESPPDTPSVLDFYGTTSPAEFFAVATEAYFMIPIAMRSAHPALYRELTVFYQTDPAALLHGNLPGN